MRKFVPRLAVARHGPHPPVDQARTHFIHHPIDRGDRPFGQLGRFGEDRTPGVEVQLDPCVAKVGQERHDFEMTRERIGVGLILQGNSPKLLFSPRRTITMFHCNFER
ncbi:hypothetical protein MTR62_12175 [Novosphingobium sp. 1949]|uniref:Uncharacterized protein n=1 Tax=Novosphingobium organovorum TaxID=2930092 RepID=A0ABT0BEG3_9SPHN|nr:hypothetical protein [Novosphingobium organovorum]MCJ2183440.1 hypothetical protein [Novosphingobium organovorum]